jgi:hypothetical protein
MLDKRIDKRKRETPEMRTLKHLDGYVRLDRNERTEICEKPKGVNVTERIRTRRKKWKIHVV